MLNLMLIRKKLLPPRNSVTIFITYCNFSLLFIPVFIRIALMKRLNFGRKQKNWEQFFTEKDKIFWEDEIMKLLERW